MKITSPPPVSPTASPKRAAKSSAESASLEEAELAGIEQSSLAEPRSFASLLDSVSDTPYEEKNDKRDSHERRERESSSTEKAETEQTDTQDMTPAKDAANASFDLNRKKEIAHSNLNSETVAGARSILHVVDLEKMVAAVRTQLLPGNRYEVTLDLNRSVLEGLRVKLSTSSGNRITAEFFAATEEMRMLLDAKSNDLSELLRSRGVRLESFKTSTNAETGFDGDDRERRSMLFNFAADSSETHTVSHTEATIEPESLRSHQLDADASAYRG